RGLGGGLSDGRDLGGGGPPPPPGGAGGGALLRAVLPLEPASPPSLEGKPVLIAAGADDPYSDRSRVEALSDRLAGGGANVELRWAQRGHELGADELDTVRDWFRRQGMQ